MKHLLFLLCGLWGAVASGVTKSSLRSISTSVEPHSYVPICIIGGGVAGYVAGYTCGNARIHALVITGDDPGGQLLGAGFVENMPALTRQRGYEIVDRLEQQLHDFGVKMLSDTVLSCEREGDLFVIDTHDGHRLYASCVIIATGASPILLSVPGESEYWSRGVFTCARCDCGAAQDEDVIVVGGGDSAIEHAMHLSSYGRTVTVLVRKSSMRAAPRMQEKLQRYRNVRVDYNKVVEEIRGDGDTVQEIVVRDLITGECYPMATRALFLAIGHRPNSALFEHLVDCDDQGHILLEGRSQATSCPGVFAAGDIADPVYRQASVAAGDASKAAFDAVMYLRERGFNDEVARELEPYYFYA